jgi:hypothetical protein
MIRVHLYVDRYDILYGGHKSDAGVGSGFRHRIKIDMDSATPQRCENWSIPLCFQ